MVESVAKLRLLSRVVRWCKDSQNGPREGEGKPERLMLKFTPVPLELEVPEI